MIRQFILLIGENRALRAEVEKLLTEAQANFVLSRAVMGEQALDEALMYPSRSIALNISSKNIQSNGRIRRTHRIYSVLSIQ